MRGASFNGIVYHGALFFAFYSLCRLKRFAVEILDRPISKTTLRKNLEKPRLVLVFVLPDFGSPTNHKSLLAIRLDASSATGRSVCFLMRIESIHSKQTMQRLERMHGAISPCNTPANSLKFNRSGELRNVVPNQTVRILGFVMWNDVEHSHTVSRKCEFEFRLALEFFFYHNETSF